MPDEFETFGIDCSYGHLKVRRGPTPYIILNGEPRKIPRVETLEEKKDTPIATTGFEGKSAGALAAVGHGRKSDVAKAVVFAGIAGLLAGTCLMWCLLAKVRHIDEQKPVFDRRYCLTDTEEKNLSELWTFLKRNKDIVPMLKKVQHYISFVNENFIDEKKKGKEDGK